MLKSLGTTFFKFFIAIAILGANMNCSDKGSTLEEDTSAAEEMETPVEEVEEPEDPTVPEDDTTPEETSGTAKIPADLMANCAQWKITYPDGAEDKTLCDEDNNEYFYVNEAKNGIVFKAPIRSTNNTTTNSTYIRSELRERTEDGTADIYWTTAGTHVVYVKQAFTQLPINKSHVVGTQIHGDKEAGIDDAMVLRLEDAHLFLSFNGNKLRTDVTIKTDYYLGTNHEVIFEVIDGKHYCYYSEDGDLKANYENGTATQYLVLDEGNAVLMDLDYDQSYFKIGNYTQSNSEKEGSDTDDPLNYGEVVVYDFFAKHF
ncbi:polysaccharide lyase family 7 protein [Cellulophaga baltica]|uniref:polysaccharide lyase family 7 protein n=1 Tax=Cellulophaga baltica TaxID=76594 RepID=UPI002495254D|nr:polysaccharide lyase family 7 protein [Cellulophaga baltica]